MSIIIVGFNYFYSLTSEIFKVSMVEARTYVIKQLINQHINVDHMFWLISEKRKLHSGKMTKFVIQLMPSDWIDSIIFPPAS